MVAGDGSDELLYVSVEVFSVAPPFGETGYHYAPPRLGVDVAGRSVSLPENPDRTVCGVAGCIDGVDGAYYPGQYSGPDPTPRRVSPGSKRRRDRTVRGSLVALWNHSHDCV
ncbi:MAG: hypothetical protein ACYDEN_14905 [Acidimicrobiales bacterium]